MKKLYDHLNEIELPLEEYEEIDVSAFEKAQLKRTARKAIAKQKRRTWPKAWLAAALTVSLTVGGVIGLANTTFAERLPFIGSIFQFFSHTSGYDVLSGYEEYSTKRALTVTDAHTTVDVRETIFDGKKFLVSYVVELSEPLGEHVWVDGTMTVNAGKVGLFNTEHSLRRLEDGRYAGISSAILPLEQTLTQGQFDIEITRFYDIETHEEITGSWQFSVEETATAATVQMLSDAVSEDGQLAVKVEEIIYTPISFIVTYEETMHDEALAAQYGIIYAELKIMDDLGNTYTGRLNGGKGQGGVIRATYTFERLHHDAKTLTILPQFIMKDSDNIFDVKETRTLSPMTIELQRGDL